MRCFSDSEQGRGEKEEGEMREDVRGREAAEINFSIATSIHMQIYSYFEASIERI